jgi:hypothetical protein
MTRLFETGEDCWNDYSVYQRTKDQNDIFVVCSEPENDFVPTTSDQKKCGLWNSSDWDCMSGGERVGVTVLLALFVGVALLFLWAIITGTKKTKNDPSTTSTSKVISNAESSEHFIKEKIAVLERLDRLIDESTETSFVATPDEEVILIASNVHLVESRKGPSRFRGSSAGVSVRLSRRVSVRSGSFSGESLSTASIPTIVDSGQFVITTKRAVFTGPKETREFVYTKLLGVNRQSFDASNSVIYLPVSARKSVSGIGTGNSSLDVIQNRLAIALELRSKTKFQMIAELRSQLDQAITDDRS